MAQAWMSRKRGRKTLGFALAHAADAVATYFDAMALRVEYAVDETFLAAHRLNLLTHLTAASEELSRYGDMLQRARGRNLGEASLQWQEESLALKLRTVSDGITRYCMMLDIMRQDIYGDSGDERVPDPSPSAVDNTTDFQSKAQGDDIQNMNGFWSGTISDGNVAQNQHEGAPLECNPDDHVESTQNFSYTANSSLGETFHAGPSREWDTPAVNPFVIPAAFPQTVPGPTPSVLGRAELGKPTLFDRGRRQTTSEDIASLVGLYSHQEILEKQKAKIKASDDDDRHSSSSLYYLCRFCDDCGKFWKLQDVTSHEKQHLVSGTVKGEPPE